MGQLQINSTSSVIEKNYDVMRGALSQLPAVYYRDFPGLGHLPVYKQLVKPSYVDWDRRAYQGEPGNFDSELRKGNFDGGETIQVTADNCECFHQQVTSKTTHDVADNQARLLV